MPVYNGEEFISETIRSVLGQSYDSLELLIVNDGSTDGTEQKILSFRDERIRYIKNPCNKGLIYSLNLALMQMKGLYMARLDADDVCDPERLANQVSMLEADPCLAMCGSYYRVINREGKEQRMVELPVADREIRTYLVFGNCFCHSSVMLRSEVILQYMYSENYELCEDYDLWLRIMKRHKMANIPQPLVNYRVHGANISVKNREGMLRSVKAIHARFLDLYEVEHTPDELEMHTAVLSFDHQTCVRLGLQKTDAWLGKLSDGLMAVEGIDRATVIKVLARRWLVICARAGRWDLLINNSLSRRYGFLYLAGIKGKALDKVMNRDRGLDL